MSKPRHQVVSTIPKIIQLVKRDSNQESGPTVYVFLTTIHIPDHGVTFLGSKMLLLILQPGLLKGFMFASDSAALFRQILTKFQTLKSQRDDVSYLKSTFYLFVFV